MANGHRKHDHAGPLWPHWGTVSVGLSSVPVNAPDTDCEFCYIGNVSSDVGYVRVITTDGPQDTPTNSDSMGVKIPEVGLYMPVTRLSKMWFKGQTGNESVTINYAKA